MDGKNGRGDARRLLFSDLVTEGSDRDLTSEEFDRFKDRIQARMRGQPVAQIIGYRDFWKSRFIVTGDVLDPRPETEHIIEAALTLPNVTRILDLGTGSGAIALSLAQEFPEAHVVATDISRSALDIARQNAEELDLTSRVTFVESCWYATLSDTFDLIVSNPPYIAQDEMAELSASVRDFEPHLALTPGGDGLESYRIIFEGAPEALRGRGDIILEHGAAQAKAVSDIAENAGFFRQSLIRDLSGLDRVSHFCGK
ncbi:MAG: peptide chain release factor N(5)-glutamine methyltransferase [Pseudomonadota bacterium]